MIKRFSDLVERAVKKSGKCFLNVKEKILKSKGKIKALVRCSHLFAKSKESKAKVGKKLFHLISGIQKELNSAIRQNGVIRNRSQEEIHRLKRVMDILLPQILHFLKTGFVAPGKIIHLQMPELYSIVRGKAGKNVEFGLKWGINRISGFVQGFLINGGDHVSDKKFCRESLEVFKSLFTQYPEVFGFDRGGYSRKNIRAIKKCGVKSVGIAPTGNLPWEVSEKMQEIIKCERAQVEGCIGNLKSQKYGFNKPRAQSVAAMEAYGQRSILGFNLSKTVRMLHQISLASVN